MSGTTLATLKRGGVRQSVKQSVNININSAPKRRARRKGKGLPPPPPSYRKGPPPGPPSSFTPNYPKLMSPAQLQFAIPHHMNMVHSYGLAPIVDMNQGHNPLRVGTNAAVREAPNAANQNQVPSQVQANLDERFTPKTKQTRFAPTMDHNAPRNMALNAQFLPTIASPLKITDPLARTKSPASKMEPIAPITHLSNIAAVAPARNAGQPPVEWLGSPRRNPVRESRMRQPSKLEDYEVRFESHGGCF